MICPKCKYEQVCPCESCKKHLNGKKPWIWDGDFISCANCGLKMHCDSWLDEEFKMIKNARVQHWHPRRSPAST